MSLDQLYVSRPTYKNPTYTSPVDGLFLCGSGAHPGIKTGLYNKTDKFYDLCL